jgi:hypothetical protein
VHQFDSGRALELVAQEVRHGACGGRRIGGLVGIGLGPIGELLQRLDRGRHHRADAEAAAGQGQRRDGDDIGCRVVGQLAVGVRVDREHRRRTQQHRLAVRRGVLQRADRQPPTGADLLLDQDVVGQLAAAEVGDAAGGRVHRTAGRKADEDARRLALRARDRGQGQRQGRE